MTIRLQRCLLASLAVIGALLTGCASPQERAREERAANLRELRERENEEIATARRRMRVMRYAVEAFLETGNRETAAMVELAIHARELAIEGDRSEEAQEVRRRAPNRGQLASYLSAASNLYRSWRQPERARALSELSEVYAEQWERERHNEGARRAEVRSISSRRWNSLEDRNNRLEILRVARMAHDEAGDRRAVEQMERVLHLGELELAGADDAAIERASEGLSQSLIIELVQGAHELYADWGHEHNADRCRRLAEFYRRRADGEQSRDREGRGRDATMSELEREVEQLQRELQELKARVRRRSK